MKSTRYLLHQHWFLVVLPIRNLVIYCNNIWFHPEFKHILKKIKKNPIIECGCKKEEKILDTFTDRYKIRKVCYHAHCTNSGQPIYENWFTKERFEKEDRKKYSIMFDKRTVF